MVDFSKLMAAHQAATRPPESPALAPFAWPAIYSRTYAAHDHEVRGVINQATRAADAKLADNDRVVQHPLPPVIEESSARPRLSRLIDEDFPFDESQSAAIAGMVNQKHACLTGAAGTGKTTCLKKLVDELQSSTSMVDMSSYFKSTTKTDDSEDDYEAPERFVPSICLCAFTGRASQMIKKNFPRDWHGNIMTIHRMLAYMPDYYEAIDEEGNAVNKMRFIPTYNETFKMPWDIIIVDEAGMLGVDLYHNILAAMKPGARLYMVGDINQLPPTHGKSVFGFAMAKWPSWELTHIHRQVGVNNSIVDNAWRVLKGLTPVSDDAKTDPNWKFVTMPLPGDAQTASRHLRAWLQKIKGPLYDPIRDSIITPINAYEHTSGYALGQDPLNRELSIMFNQQTEENPRYIIDAGRDRKYFAVGDKVMATRNDYETGITNGMTGIITKISRNGAYSGDTRRFDTIDNVNKYAADAATWDDEDSFSLADLASAIESEAESLERKKKETRDRGPASHIVTVKFGESEHAFEIHFATLAEVASLMMAYVVTCHKMQGGEVPVVIIILHHAHKRMLFREWLYTAITRASQRCIVLYTPMGMASALNKQNIKGSTLAQKVAAFQKLSEEGIVGSAINVRLPEPESYATGLAPRTRTILESGRDKLAAEIAALDGYNHGQACTWCGTYHDGGPENCPPDETPPPAPTEIERSVIIERVILESVQPKAQEPVNGGDLTVKEAVPFQLEYQPQRKKIRPLGAIRVFKQHRAARNQLRLTYNKDQTMLYMMKQLQGDVPQFQAPPKPEIKSQSVPVITGFKLNLARLK